MQISPQGFWTTIQAIGKLLDKFHALWLHIDQNCDFGAERSKWTFEHTLCIYILSGAHTPSFTTIGHLHLKNGAKKLLTPDRIAHKPYFQTSKLAQNWGFCCREGIYSYKAAKFKNLPSYPKIAILGHIS